jgi:hypothetical protein
MHEFETFVYLDVRKTGTTFIHSFLRRFCRERKIFKNTHEGMPADCDRSKFYFISVRNPLDQYRSLYSYGCGQKGLLASKLLKHGLGDLYNGTQAGFRSWLDFVLDPENARMLGEDYGKQRHVSDLIGLQSYRVLSLALPGAAGMLEKCESREAIATAYVQHNLSSYTIRTESLRADLKQLFSTRLQSSLHDVPAAIRFIEDGPAMNVSSRTETELTLDNAQTRRLEEREWFLHDMFYRSDRVHAREAFDSPCRASI